MRYRSHVIDTDGLDDAARGEVCRVVLRTLEDVWRAFATFAGHAYDASAWSDTRILPIVSLADAGTALVVRVDEDERAALEAALRPLGVRPRPGA